MQFGMEIVGFGTGIPEKILTNSDLSKIVDTSDEWIYTRTGIKERRIVNKDQATSDLCYMAAIEAMEQGNVDPKDLDLIVIGTSSPDFMTPSTSAILQKKLGATNAAAFDVGAACSGFAYSLVIAENFIKLGQYKTILVIGGEILSKFLDWNNRNTCVLFGDGAGAIVMKATEDTSKGILSFDLGADGNGYDKIICYYSGSKYPATTKIREKTDKFLQIDGRDVFKFAVTAVPKTMLKTMEKSDYTFDDVKLIIPHQANYRIIESVSKRLNLPMEKFFLNIEKYGNTSAASVAIALKEAVEQKRVGKGDLVLLIGFGAGYTYASSLIRL